MFILKKILSSLFQPLPLGLEIIACGLMLLKFTRHQRWGRVVTTAGFLIIVLLSLEPVSDHILRPLEHQYPPFMCEETGEGITPLFRQVPWIVVLGGGAQDDPEIPVNSRLGLESLARLAEAVRLYRKLPGVRLILSGGALFGLSPEADALAETALIMGVPAQDLLLERRSRDTEEQALLIRPLVGNAPFLLVTSAYHMPRAIALFRKQGMVPIPAPAAFMARTFQWMHPASYVPNASSLQNTERAFHEYLGLGWAWLRGRS
jgi:uncharacterized SAM-binding protein YcdF (DUF218 family)